MDATNKIDIKPKEFLTEKMTDEGFKNSRLRMYNSKHEFIGYSSDV